VNSDGAIHTVKVIGFIPSGNAWPLAFVSARTGQEVYGSPVESNWFVFRVKPGVDANQVQASLTATFGQKYGMQPELNSAGATKLSSFLTSVFNMLAGYLTLGLVIGLCGLAVISRRVVLERVQQIGIMRAIGCGSEQIPRIFLLESSFIAFLGLFIGAALALWWAYQFTMIAFPPIDANDYVFQVPAIQIGVIIVAFYLIILVATYLPARTASRIAPAAALRYE
jgi:ABC-type lipoprotein release transport system permease subunit